MITTIAKAVETRIAPNQAWEFVEPQSATMDQMDASEWVIGETTIDETAAIRFDGDFEDQHYVIADQGGDRLRGVLAVEDDTLVRLITL
jgi:hypothetical protein